jgi:putative DNA methylase
VKADKVKSLSAVERRRESPLRDDEAQQVLFGRTPGDGKRLKKVDALKIHPRDPVFRTHLDRAHALALAYSDASGGKTGIGAAKSFAVRHGIKAGDPTVRLIEALLGAAPAAVRRDTTEIARKFPEFRAWHDLLEPLFGITPPDWTEKGPDQQVLELLSRPTATDEEDDVLVEEEEAKETDEDEEEE